MKKFFSLCLLALSVCTSRLAAQSHGHLNIGADAGALVFENGDLFATNTGFVMTLNYTNGGTYTGYYQGNITLAVLAATAGHGGPVPGAPELGSYIYAQIVSVEGPAGGIFCFWDTGALSPTISVASGTTGATNIFKVSENDGSPGTDPYGHIHGRRFTANKPGVYLVGFRAVDFSTNGVGGGALQTPSPVLQFYFQAGVNISSVTTAEATSAVTFGAPNGKTCTLQYLDGIGQTNWVSGESVVGADAFQTINDVAATNSARFYRVKID